MPASLQKIIPQIHSSKGGRIVTYPEAATQSFPAYFPVYLVSGAVTAWSTVGTTATSLTTGDNDFLGLALRAASGTTGTDIPVFVFDENTELILPLRHGTTTTSSDYANVTVGSTYTAGLISDILVVNNETTTNGVFTVVEKLPGFATTEDYVPVVVKVVDAARQLG